MAENVDLKTDVVASDEGKATENEAEVKAAENTAAEVRKEEEKTDEEVEKGEAKTDDEGKEKTFTQKEVDEIVSEKTKELQGKLDKYDRKEMLNKKGTIN